MLTSLKVSNTIAGRVPGWINSGFNNDTYGLFTFTKPKLVVPWYLVIEIKYAISQSALIGCAYGECFAFCIETKNALCRMGHENVVTITLFLFGGLHGTDINKRRIGLIIYGINCRCD